MDVEAEIRDLKRRMGELEGVSSFGLLTRAVSSLHKDLLVFQGRTEERFRKVDELLDRTDGKIDALDRKIGVKIDGLRRDLPGIIGETMRDYEIKSKRK